MYSATVYISGPMSGYIEHNYPTFNRAADILRKAGHVVLNPAEHFGGDHDRPRSEYLRKDIEEVLKADAICLLPEWHTSPGATLEVAIAFNLGMRNFIEVNLEESTWHWVGYESHVRVKLPGGIVPAGDPSATAPGGESGMQPTWWRYEGSSLDPTGTGVIATTADFPALFADAFARAALKEPQPWPAGLLTENGVVLSPEDALTRETLGEAPPPVPDELPRIVDEAWGLVMGNRQASYGHPASDFAAMGRISAAILSRWLESEGLVVVPQDQGDGPVYLPDIPPRIVALLMTAVKLSRESAQHKHDNLVDLIGYTICSDRIVEGY